MQIWGQKIEREFKVNGYKLKQYYETYDKDNLEEFYYVIQLA